MVVLKLKRRNRWRQAQIYTTFKRSAKWHIGVMDIAEAINHSFHSVVAIVDSMVDRMPFVSCLTLLRTV